MRYTLDFGPKGEANLKKLAEIHETSKADAIRRAVALYSALTDETEKGFTVVLRAPDGAIRELMST
jgi:hypothetical protein